LVTSKSKKLGRESDMTGFRSFEVSGKGALCSAQSPIWNPA
jgi:hypothetical protein